MATKYSKLSTELDRAWVLLMSAVSLRDRDHFIDVIKQLEAEIAPGLIDFNFGEWQGLSLQEVKDSYKEPYQ